MRQRLRELESTVSAMRKQLGGMVGLGSGAVGTQQSPNSEETTGSKIPAETAVQLETQQPRGFGDIIQGLAVELADLGTELLLEFGALATLGALCFLASKNKINMTTCTGKNMVTGKG